ncbi:MAG: ATP-binding protein [Verrucomicrobiota bacterium]
MKINEFKDLVIPSEIPREPELPQLSETDLEQHLNLVVRDKLLRVMSSLTLFYVLYGVYAVVVYPWTQAFPMLRLSLCSAALVVGLGFACRRWPVPVQYAHPFSFFLAGLVLSNCWLHFYLFEDPYQTCVLMLLIVGAATLVTAFRWFLLIVVATILVWGCAALGGDMSWFYFGFGLLAATLLGLILNRAHIGRERELASLAFVLADRRKHLGEFVMRTHAAEERCHKMAEATFEGILFHDAGKIIDANQAALELFGYELEEIRGLEILDLIAPESRQLAANQLRFGTVQSNCVNGLRKNRTEFLIEIFNKSISMQDRPLLVMAVRDIGAQREAQLALGREKKELEAQFSRQMAITQLDGGGEQVEDPQVMLDRITRTATEMLPASLGTCVLFWKGNESVFQVGSVYPPNTGLKPGTLVPATMNSAHAYILESGEPLVLSSISGDSLGIRQSFPGLPIQACAGVPLLSNGRIIGILYAFDRLSRQYRSEDMEFLRALANRASIILGKSQLFHQLRIANQSLQSQHATLQQTIGELETAKTTAEEANQNLRFKQEQLQETIVELERAKELIESAARAKSEFLATISHELRTPLNGVLGMAEMLRTADLGAQHQVSVEMLCESAKRLQRLIEHMLTFADTREQHLGLKREPLDPALCVRQAVEEFAADARAKGVRLTCQPEESLAGSWLGDPGKIQEVLRQLVGNAVKFTDAGEIIVTCKVRENEPGGARFRFVVRDSGVGIPEEARGRIFGLFSQADGNATRQHEGAGLGLALAKQLVKLMGGEIDFTSQPGRGSEFWFEITAESATPTGGDSAFPLVPIAKNGLMRLKPAARVLVVDSESDHGKDLAAKLQSLNFRPLVVQSNYEVIPALQREKVLYDPIQAVILDASVSLEETLLLAETLHGDSALAVPALILMLRPGQNPDAQMFRQAGVTSWFFKPAARNKLAECLNQLS